MADNFGERAATTAEVTAWVALVKAGKRAARDRMRDSAGEEKEEERLPRPNT